MKATLDRYFHISERGSSIGTELRAGTVSFFAMAYIILLNPLILGTTEDAEGYALGVPQVAAATALVAGVLTILALVMLLDAAALAPGEPVDGTRVAHALFAAAVTSPWLLLRAGRRAFLVIALVPLAGTVWIGAQGAAVRDGETRPLHPQTRFFSDPVTTTSESAILTAAEKPRREITVGGAGRAAARSSPAW